MERGSDKHSPRIDEELDRETRALLQSGVAESRLVDAYVKEGLLADEQPRVGPGGIEAPAGPGQPPAQEIDLRSELARWIEPHVFPARTDALAVAARNRFAPDWLVDMLERLPDRTFDTVEDVWEALGGHRERRA